MNPTKDIDRDRLKKAMEASRQLTQGDRERYARIVRKVANAGGTKRRGRVDELMRPIMLLRQSLQTFKAQLTGGEVRFQCEYPNTARDRFAKIQEAHLNELTCEMKLSATLATAVTSSFFKEGIVMLHMAEDNPLLMQTDNIVTPGRPSVTNIPWGDYGEDMTANHPSRRQFQFHYYEVALESLKDDKSYNRDVVQRIVADDKQGMFYDRRDAEEARTAFGFSPNRERLAFDTVRLVDVYVPHLKTKFTWTYRMDTAVLREMPIDDPDGPYRKLTLDEIPDNVMACSQAESLEHLDDLHNSAWRKISSMIAATRDLILYEEGETEAAENIRTAQHGKTIKVRNADAIRKESFGGVSKNLAVASQMTSEMFNRMDNNLALRSGSGAQSPTASQDQLLAQSSGTLTGYNLQKILEFYSTVGDGVRRLIWNDELMSRDASYEHKMLPGYRVHAPWRPGVREGERDSYRCRVVPYTIRMVSPEEKAAKLLNTLDRLQPYMGVFQQAGRTPDPDVLIDVLAEAGLPEMRKLFQITDPVEPTGSGGDRPLQSPNTTRTQIRKSEAAGDPMQQLVGAMEGE